MVFTTNTDIEPKGTSAMNTLGTLVLAATVAFVGLAAAVTPVSASTPAAVSAQR